MRYFYILLYCCLAQHSLAQSNIYDITMHTIDSSDVSLKAYRGSKIVIATGNPRQLQKAGVRFLDSLQTDFPSIKFIAIPTQDSASDEEAKILTAIKGNRFRKSMLADVAYIRDSTSEKQNPLIKYITNAKENSHFDMRLNTDFNLFFISESGILYGVLERFSNRKTLADLLSQEDVKQ